MSRRSASPTEPELPRSERDALRTSLRALVPGPEFEDRVLRRLAQESATPGTSPWRWIGSAALAASILLALFVVLPTPSRDGPLEADDNKDAPGAFQKIEIVSPPSAHEVHVARQRNKLPNVETINGWIVVTEEGGRFTRPAASSPGPRPEARHAWLMNAPEMAWVLFGTAQPIPETPHFTHGMLPPKGVMYVGRGLLGKLGITSFFEGDDLVLRDKQGRTLRCDAGSSTIDLDIASPYEGGPRAKVRALVSSAYTGSLALGPELGRALDLHLAEIPGAFTCGRTPDNPTFRGHRAHARVRIAELEFDEIIEVQVREDRKPVGFPTTGKLQGILQLEGVLPETVVRAATIERKLEHTPSPESAGGAFGSLGYVHTTENARAYKLGGNQKSEALQLVGQGTSDFELGYSVGSVALRRLDVGLPVPHTVTVTTRWWKPELRVTPESYVIAARVWKGRHPVPSLEGVGIGYADDEGRIQLPRVAGEQGNTLRVLVVPKDGSEGAFHDVPLPYDYLESVRGGPRRR